MFELYTLKWLSVRSRPSADHSDISTPLFFSFLKYFYCIPSDFSDLPDMTDEYVDLAVCALTAFLLYLL